MWGAASGSRRLSRFGRLRLSRRRLSSGCARRRLVGLRRPGAVARPRLVELDAPLAVIALLEREPRAERLARAALEARDGARGAPGGDELLGDRLRQRLARLALPDDEAAARILA